MATLVGGKIVNAMADDFCECYAKRAGIEVSRYARIVQTEAFAEEEGISERKWRRFEKMGIDQQTAWKIDDEQMKRNVAVYKKCLKQTGYDFQSD